MGMPARSGRNAEKGTAADPAPAALMIGVRARLQQVGSNLLSNAKVHAGWWSN